MRALFLCALMGVVVGGTLFACNPNSIGRPCVNPGGQAVQGVQVASPALECPSRLCLIQPNNAGSGNTSTGDDGGTATQNYHATCTASCETNSDCEAETKEGCKAGFVCAVATQGGPFCCKKLCVCKTDLVEGTNVDVDGGIMKPLACDKSADPYTTCPNAK